MKVRDPAAASSRLTRWNSWTDGESPDGKSTRWVTVGLTSILHLLDARSPCARTRGQTAMTGRGRRARRDDARPRARRHARRAARPQPPRRLRAPRRRTARRSPRASTGAPARRTPRSTRWPGPGTAPAAAPPSSRSSRATTPAAPAPARRRWSPPASPGSCSPRPTPNPVARGGAETLRAAGVDVEGGLLVDEARAVNRAWTFAVEHGRPFVTWKLATTLDGRSAAADGTSRWVSSLPARRDTHRLRAAQRRDPGRHRHGPGRRPAAHRARRRRRRRCRATGSCCAR